MVQTTLVLLSPLVYRSLINTIKPDERIRQKMGRTFHLVRLAHNHARPYYFILLYVLVNIDAISELMVEVCSGEKVGRVKGRMGGKVLC